MGKPFTFHMQIREELYAQNEVEKLRRILAEPDAFHTLNSSGIIHFARTVLIPNDRITPATKGTFAIQVIIVYDGKLKDLVAWLAETEPIRLIFQQISAIAKAPCPNPDCTKTLQTYLLQNNLTRTKRELHMGYNLTVQEIRNRFKCRSSVAESTGNALQILNHNYS